MMKNIRRQPNAAMSAVKSGGASAGPRLDDELNRPVGNPRSRMWYQLLTTRAPVGNCGASPMPSAMRVATNCRMLVANPPHACATDQRASPAASKIRGPTLSTKAPVGNCAKA